MASSRLMRTRVIEFQEEMFSSLQTNSTQQSKLPSASISISGSASCPRACSIQLGDVVPLSLQLLWAQHARSVDACTRNKDLKTDYKKLLAEHAEHVGDSKRKALPNEECVKKCNY